MMMTDFHSPTNIIIPCLIDKVKTMDTVVPVFIRGYLLTPLTRTATPTYRLGAVERLVASNTTSSMLITFLIFHYEYR